jgi:hypothetical protein
MVYSLISNAPTRAQRVLVITGQPPPALARRTNGPAIAALVCGIVQFGFPPAGIAAIILGHRALYVIRRTGEDGYGLVKAGSILGYLVLAFALIVTLIGFGAQPVHGHSGP